MTNKIREILKEWFRNRYDDCIDFNHDSSHATEKLKQFMLDCVGKEKEMSSHQDLCLLSNEDRATEEGEINGYNQAIQDIKAKLEKE